MAATSVFGWVHHCLEGTKNYNEFVLDHLFNDAEAEGEPCEVIELDDGEVFLNIGFNSLLEYGELVDLDRLKREFSDQLHLVTAARIQTRYSMELATCLELLPSLRYLKLDLLPSKQADGTGFKWPELPVIRLPELVELTGAIAGLSNMSLPKLKYLGCTHGVIGFDELHQCLENGAFPQLEHMGLGEGNDYKRNIKSIKCPISCTSFGLNFEWTNEDIKLLSKQLWAKSLTNIELGLHNGFDFSIFNADRFPNLKTLTFKMVNTNALKFDSFKEGDWSQIERLNLCGQMVEISASELDVLCKKLPPKMVVDVRYSSLDNFSYDGCTVKTISTR